MLLETRGFLSASPFQGGKAVRNRRRAPSRRVVAAPGYPCLAAVEPLWVDFLKINFLNLEWASDAAPSLVAEKANGSSDFAQAELMLGMFERCVLFPVKEF